MNSMENACISFPDNLNSDYATAMNYISDTDEIGEIYEVNLNRSTYQGVLIKGLQSLREEDFLCDYTLQAENLYFRVHKAVLASVSAYFRALFRSGMIEVQNDQMELKGVSGTGLQGVIYFIYSGKLRLNERNVMEIFKAANHLQIDPIITACTQYFIKNLSLENIKDMQTIVSAYHLEPLKQAIHALLLTNFTRFSRTNYFKQLPLPEVCNLLKENNISCSSEFKLMKIIFEWIKYSSATREPLISNLMKNMRLVSMTTEELQYLKQIPFIKNNKHCLSLIAKAVYFKNHPQKQALLVSPECEPRNDKTIVAFGCNQQRAMTTCILYKGHWCTMDKTMDQPRPLVNAAAVVHNNFLYICGGEGIREATSSCLCFNPYTCRWSTISPMNNPRKNFALVAHAMYLYAICGISRNSEVLKTVEVFSLETNAWTYASSYKCRVADIAACAEGRNIYVAGGMDDNCFHIRDFSMYNTQDDTWDSGPNISEIMFKPTMFSISGSVYIVDLYRTEGILAHIEKYNPMAKQWTIISLPGVQFSRSFSAVNIEDWIYFIGRNDVDDGSSKKYNIRSGVCEDIRCFPWEVECPVSVAINLQKKFIKQSIRNFIQADRLAS